MLSINTNADVKFISFSSKTRMALRTDNLMTIKFYFRLVAGLSIEIDSIFISTTHMPSWQQTGHIFWLNKVFVQHKQSFNKS